MEQLKEWWQIIAATVGALLSSVWYIAHQQTRISHLERRARNDDNNDKDVARRISNLETQHQVLETKLDAIGDRTEDMQEDLKTLLRRTDR